jgi:hypothetical protein
VFAFALSRRRRLANVPARLRAVLAVVVALSVEAVAYAGREIPFGNVFTGTAHLPRA